MENSLHPLTPAPSSDQFRNAWNLAKEQLRQELPARSVQWDRLDSLQPLGCEQNTYRLGASDADTRDYIDHRLRSTLSRTLSGLMCLPLNVTVELNADAPRVPAANHIPGTREFYAPVPLPPEMDDTDEPPAQNADIEQQNIEEASSVKAKDSKEKKRKVTSRALALESAYGTKRAAIIHPEHGMFVTAYFFSSWLPLIGHSAMAVILAARSMCYWNPMTGELRNQLNIEIADLAEHASVSIRTVKEVLNNDLIKRYFLRYSVRRVMTGVGIRTAGIALVVRMDDPVTPADQEKHGVYESDTWYTSSLQKEDEVTSDTLSA